MTRPFQTAYAVSSQPTELVNLCLNQLDLGEQNSTLGFIYLSDALAREMAVIVQRLREETGVEHWVGSVGVALCTSRKEIYDSAAMVIMLTDIRPDHYQLIPRIQTDADTFFHTTAPWQTEHQPHVAVVHADPSNPATPVIIENISASMHGGFLTGGLTSTQSEFRQVAGDMSDSGLSGVVFSSSQKILTAHTQGCSPLHSLHTITECHRNVISKLDDRPALEVLKEDVGEVLSRDLNRLGGYIFAGLPIPGSDTRDYLVRNLLGIDPNREVIAIGELVEEGDPLLFCRRDGNTAREDMLRMLENLKSRVGNQPIRGALYHSCLGRGRHQFGDESEELAMIADVLGDVPLVGFFANGEIFHNRVYAYTGVITLFL